MVQSAPRILVIDDEPAVRQVFARVLRLAGYDVVLAENGDHGLQQFRSEDPDLVITDIVMPEKNGIEVIREIRQASPETRIIAMSGGGRVGDVDFLDMAARLGATEIIHKPFDPATLLDAVARCLAGGATNDEQPG
jgi:CheY-like chemotaxis protein